MAMADADLEAESDLCAEELFLFELAVALHQNGSPTPSLETQVGDCARRLRLQMQVNALPSLLTLVFQRPAGQHTRYHRCPPSDYNLDRLMALEALCSTVSTESDIQDLRRRLHAICASPAPWQGLHFIGCCALLSLCIARLFGGSWPEMISGGLLGLIFGAALMGASRWPRLTPLLPFLLCLLTACSAHALLLILPGQDPFISILSGIVLLLPGFTATIALAELATHHLLSGTARLAGAAILLMMMAFGATIGTMLGSSLIPVQTLPPANPMPDYTIWLCVAGLGFALMAPLQSRLRTAPWIIGACLLAVVISKAATALGGPVCGAFCAAFGVSAAGHLYRIYSGKSALLLRIPGLIVLVPGSVGYLGLNALLHRDTLSGLDTLFTMLLTATALVVGTLLAHSIMPEATPRLNLDSQTDRKAD